VCTLIALLGFLEDYPVMVLHNRYLNRGTLEEPPRVFSGVRRVYAPYDVASKGTWIGFNESGLLVAITNQETDVLEKPARSRGLLAMDLLDGCDSADEAKCFLTDPDVRWDYKRGNFLVADADSAWHVVWDKETNVQRLDSGSYTITTLTLFPGVDWSERAERMWENAERRRIRALQLLDNHQPGDIEGLTKMLKEISADHGVERGASSICYHYPTSGYIQTSSTVIAVGADVSESRMHYCPGNPCENAFIDYSGLVEKG
jgi:uncharacterized protein with NRDE domain